MTILAVGAGLCVLAYRVLVRPSVVVSDAGVVVRNPFATVEVPWEDVDRFEAVMVLFVHRRDGSFVRAWAIDVPPLTRVLDRESNADRVAAVLNERLASAMGR